jgi:hypothetical protein
MMTFGRMLELLPHLLLYFAPTIVGWLRIRSRQAATVPLWWLFALNLFFGWTTIGWILLWPLALGWLVPKLSPADREPRPVARPEDYEFSPGIWNPEPENRQTTIPAPPPFTPFQWEEPVQEMPCHCCGNQGAVCPACMGTRGKMVLPQTENGTSYWVDCPYCLGRGRVQCSTCGRSG